jgi:hypothetical protein
VLVGEIAFKLNADTAAFSRSMSKAAAEVRALKDSVGDMKLTVDIDVDKNAFRQKVRAAVAASSQNAVKVDLEIDTQGFRRDVRATVAAAQGNAVKVDLSLDSGGFREKVRAAVSGASGQNVKIDFDVNVSRLRSQVREATNTARGNAIKVSFDVDTGRLRTQVREATRTAAGNAIKVAFDVDTAGLRSKLKEAVSTAQAGLRFDIPIHVDSTGFRQEIRRAILAGQAGQKVTVPIHTSGSAGGASSDASKLSSLTSGGGGGGGGFMGLSAGAIAAIGVGITGLVGDVVALGAALAPVVALMGSAMPMAGMGMVSVMGSLFTALKGPIGALSAMNAAQTTSAATAGTAAKAAQAHADAVQSASRQVASAQSNVSQAYVQAGRAAADSAAAVVSAQSNLKQVVSDVADANAAAAQRVAQAEQDVYAAQTDARRAQQDLNEARAQAVIDIDNMRRSLRMTALDERGAVLDVQEALDNLNKAKLNSTPDTMAFKRAQLNYDRSVANLDDIRNRLKQEQQQVAYNARTGVDGQKSVQNASDNYYAALGKVASAQEAVKIAQQEQAKVAIKGQQQIADAQNAVAKAIESQRRSAEDSARSIAQAQQSLADAQDALAKAMRDTGDTGAAAADKVAAAMAKLSPAGRELVNTIWAMKPAWEAIQRASQEAMAPGLIDMLHSLQTMLPTITGVIVATSGALGGLARDFGALVSSPMFQRDIGTVGAANAVIIKNLGGALLSVLDIFRNLSAAVAPFIVAWSVAVKQWFAGAAAAVQLARDTGALTSIFEKAKVVGQELGRIFGQTFRGLWEVLKIGFPYGKQLLDIIEGWATHFHAWTKTVQGQEQINKFFQGSVVIFKILGIAIGIVGQALLWAVTMFSKLGGVADWLSTHISLVRDAVIALAAAFAVYKVGSPILKGIESLAPLFGALLTPVGLVVAALAVMAAGVAYLFVTNKGFHDWVIGAWNDIKGSFSGAWDAIKKSAQETWPIIKEVVADAVDTLSRALQAVLKPAIDHIVPALAALWTAMWNLIGLASDIAKPFLDLAIALGGPIFHGAAVLFQGIADALQSLTGFLRDNREIVIALGVAWAVLKGQVIATAVISGLTTAWMGVTRVLTGIGGVIASVTTSLMNLGAGSLLAGTAMAGGLVLGVTAAISAFIGYASAAEKSRQRNDEFRQSLSSAGSDLDSLTALIKKYGDEWQAASDKLFGPENESNLGAAARYVGLFMGQITGSTQNAERATNDYKAAQEAAIAQANQVTGNLSNLGERYGLTTEQVKALAKATGVDLTQGQDAANLAFGRAYEAMRNGVPQSAALSSQIVTITGNEDAVTKATDAWSHSLDLLFAPFADYETACTTLAGDVDAVNLALKNSQGALDNATAASRTSRQALTDEARENVTVAKALEKKRAEIVGSDQAQREANASLDLNNNALYANAIAHGANRTELTAWADAMGWSKEQVAALNVVTDANATASARAAAQMVLDRQVATDYGQTLASLRDHIVTLPDGRQITINLNDHDAIAKLEAAGLKVKTLPDGTIEITGDPTKLNQTLDAIPHTGGPVVVPVIPGWSTIPYTPGALPGTPGGRFGPANPTPAHAAGGWINGPGTGTSDSINARLSNGEFVVNARAAAANGAILQRINSFAGGGVVGKDGIPGFAGGGVVSLVASGAGLTISGDLSPISVSLVADAAPLYSAIAAFHPVQWVTLAPDFARVYAGLAAFHPVTWLGFAPDLARVYAGIAAFHPVAWLSLDADLARAYATVAAFHPVTWITLSIDPSQFLATLNNVTIQVAARMQQLVGSENFMAAGVNAAVNWAIASHTRLGASTDAVEANAFLRMHQFVADEDFMALGVANAVDRAIAAHTRLGASTDAVEANAFLRMHQFAADETYMADFVRDQTGRAIAYHTQLGASTDALEANAFLRFHQFAADITYAADFTRDQTNRIIGSYDAMQRRVDALHGRDITITSTANVKYPDPSVLKKGLSDSISVLKAVPVAQGMVFSRANGGVDNLPGHAVISSARGAGLVQWAEQETGGEAFIPLSPSKRARSTAIWEETGKRLGTFAGGGLLHTNTTHTDGNWHPKTAQVQTDTENAATQLGQAVADKLKDVAGAQLAATATAQLAAAWAKMQAPQGTGYSANGNWAPNVRPWVEYIARSLNISAFSYAGHHPAENYAADLAYGQAGMVNTAPSIGPSGSDLYSNVARWVQAHVIDIPSPGWYEGVHAGIHSRGQQGFHPAGDQVGRRGQTYAHDDHVHVSFDPRGGVPMIGVPGNSSLPGFNWDHGGAAPNVAIPSAGGALGAAVGSSAGQLGPAGMHFSQGQMQAALAGAGFDANMAHIFSAIGMGETGGWLFPTSNPTGRYHGPWAFQEAWAIPAGLNMDALDHNLNYAAQQVKVLYDRAGWQPWYGDSPQTGGNYQRFMGDGGVLKMNKGGYVEGTGPIDSVPAMLTPGEYVLPKQAMRSRASGAIDFSMAGYKPLAKSPFGGAGKFMGGQWSPAGDWTTERQYAAMKPNQQFAYWNAFPEVVAYFKKLNQTATFNKIAALAKAASVMHHPPAGYMSWPFNQQFAYWARFPSVVALLKAMAANAANITNKPKGDIWHGGHYQLYGKQIPGMAAGGPVSGDTVAQLHAGEYVIPALAAKRYGPLLAALSGKRGTPAPSIHDAAAGTSASSSTNVEHTWHINVAEGTNPRNVARELAWEFMGARGA